MNTHLSNDQIALFTAIVSNILLAIANIVAAVINSHNLTRTSDENRMFISKTNAYSDLLRATYKFKFEKSKELQVELAVLAQIAMMYSSSKTQDAIMKYTDALTSGSDELTLASLNARLLDLMSKETHTAKKKPGL